ncbi:hypothetical protein BDF14DRAFT_1963475, partial [Spinellus fusiger]
KCLFLTCLHRPRDCDGSFSVRHAKEITPVIYLASSLAFILCCITYGPGPLSPRTYGVVRCPRIRRARSKTSSRRLLRY